MKIMFICTGNICRSAMAEAILKDKIKNNNPKNIEVYSAGTYAETGDVPTREMIETMDERNINARTHRATNINDSDIEQMDIILCATNNHKRQVIMEYPNLINKIYTIEEYAYDVQKDIPDPWGYGKEVYEKCAEEIEKCIDKIIEKL